MIEDRGHDDNSFEVIRWRALLRTPLRKVEGFLRRFSELLGAEVQMEACEPYWKDGALVDVHFNSPLHLMDVRDATFEALLLCQRLLPDWRIKGPWQYEGDRWELYGMARDDSRGMVMMEFWVRNFLTEWPGSGEERAI